MKTPLTCQSSASAYTSECTRVRTSECTCAHIVATNRRIPLSQSLECCIKFRLFNYLRFAVTRCLLKGGTQEGSQSPAWKELSRRMTMLVKVSQTTHTRFVWKLCKVMLFMWTKIGNISQKVYDGVSKSLELFIEELIKKAVRHTAPF